MAIGIIFAWLLFGITLALAADKLYVKISGGKGWKDITADILKVAFTYGAALYSFWQFHGYVAITIQNTIATLLTGQGNKAATALTAIIIALSSMLTGYILYRWVIKPTKPWQKVLIALATIIGATTWIIVYLAPNFTSTGYFYTFFLQTSIFLLIAIVAYWKSYFQQKFAIVIPYLLINSIIVLNYYLWYGINPIPNIEYVDLSTIGALVIINTIFCVYTVIWDRGKPWYEKWSYKAINFGMILMFIFAAGHGFLQMFGAINSQERKIIALNNLLQARVLYAEIEASKTSIKNGLSYTDTRKIINNPRATLDELKKAADYMDQLMPEVENKVAEAPGPSVTWNKPTVKRWEDKFYRSLNFFKGIWPFSEKRTPPRDVGWMSLQIATTPVKIVRVYNGDKFVYKSPLGFWIVEEGGQKHFHNPSLQPGEIRSFTFYDLPAEGRQIGIQAVEEKTPFWMDFRITRGQM